MPPMFREDVFFQAIASRRIPRIRIAAIVIDGGEVLVQRPANNPTACYAFIGGEYEIGDTFDSRIRAEFEEETNVHVIDTQYLFCIESRYQHADLVIQQVDHYLLTRIDRRDVASGEGHLRQLWLPLSRLSEIDLRPYAVRDALIDGSFMTIRHLEALEV